MYISEIVITALLFLVVLDVDSLASFFFLVVFTQVLIILVLVLRLQSALGLEVLLATLVASFGAEASPCLAHLIEQIVAAARLALAPWLWVVVVVEYLLVLRSLLIQLQVLNDLLVLLLPLHLLQVVFVQLVLEVVDVRELLHIDRVETLQLRLETLILLLVLRLHVLDALQALLCTLVLLLSTLDFIVKFGLIQPELLDCVVHLSHLPRLCVNDITNTLLNICLLGVGVQVAGDRVQELESLVASLPQLPLLSEEVEELGSALSDLSGESAGSLEVV